MSGYKKSFSEMKSTNHQAISQHDKFLHIKLPKPLDILSSTVQNITNKFRGSEGISVHRGPQCYLSIQTAQTRLFHGNHCTGSGALQKCTVCEEGEGVLGFISDLCWKVCISDRVGLFECNRQLAHVGRKKSVLKNVCRFWSKLSRCIFQERLCIFLQDNAKLHLLRQCEFVVEESKW